jgi:hypothetical protein
MTAIWPIEAIPDDDILYMRVHRQWLRDETVIPGCFRNRPDDISGGTANDTLRRARNPIDNAVIQLHIGTVRQIPEQRVAHSPMPENRAHTDVLGPKEHDPEVRRLFSRACRIVVPLVTTT